MPPISSGGIALIEMLNILEGYDLKAIGFGSAQTIHLDRRGDAARVRRPRAHLGDPDFNPDMPIERLTSKDYAASLRKTISPTRASVSSPTSFDVADETRRDDAPLGRRRRPQRRVADLHARGRLRLENRRAGRRLPAEQRDGRLQRRPGLTTAEGLIGTAPNLAEPGKRMLSSMTPTILAKDGKLFMVTGSPGGRTIINTVLLTILNVVDFGMNAQEAVDAPPVPPPVAARSHHVRALPFSPDTRASLEAKGHDSGDDESRASPR